MFEDDDEDPWPDEPDEFDPDSLGPSVDIPEAPDVSASDVDGDLFQAFWATVVMANIALFGISIGLMLLVFRGEVQSGGAAVLIGLLAAVFGYRYYAGYQRDRQG